MESQILITGATGFLGRHLTEKLIALGHYPRILVRDPKKIPPCWNGKVDITQGDLLNFPSLHKALRGIRWVFHLAAESRDKELFHKTNVLGTENLMKACLNSNIGKLIHLSSIAVFGSLKKETITEEDQCIPKDEYDRSKHLGEEYVKAFHRKTGIPTIILRPSFILGEGREIKDDRFYQWLFLVKKGFFRFMGKGNYVLNFIYVGDVVEGILISAKGENLGFKTYILSDPCLLKEFMEWCAQALEVSLPKRVIPLSVTYPAAILSQCINMILPWKIPFSLGKLRLLTNKTIYSSEKIKKELEFNPPFGIRKGLLRTVEWYKKRNKLAM